MGVGQLVPIFQYGVPTAASGKPNLDFYLKIQISNLSEKKTNINFFWKYKYQIYLKIQIWNLFEMIDKSSYAE